jgi:hypothetical protein
LDYKWNEGVGYPSLHFQMLAESINRLAMVNSRFHVRVTEPLNNSPITQIYQRVRGTILVKDGIKRSLLSRRVAKTNVRGLDTNTGSRWPAQVNLAPCVGIQVNFRQTCRKGQVQHKLICESYFMRTRQVTRAQFFSLQHAVHAADFISLIFCQNSLMECSTSAS